jgi:hypothetical protein
MLATFAKTCPRFTRVPPLNPDLNHTCQYCVITVPNDVLCRISTPPLNCVSIMYPMIVPSAAALTGAPTAAFTSVPVCSHTAPFEHERKATPLQYRHWLPNPRQCGCHEDIGSWKTSAAGFTAAGVGEAGAGAAAIAMSCANSIRMPMNPPIRGEAQLMSTMTFFSSV